MTSGFGGRSEETREPWKDTKWEIPQGKGANG